jgi:hypothetical protein
MKVRFPPIISEYRSKVTVRGAAAANGAGAVAAVSGPGAVRPAAVAGAAAVSKEASRASEADAAMTRRRDDASDFLGTTHPYSVACGVQA